MSSSSFLVVSFRFSIFSIMSSTNSSVFLLLFLFGLLSFIFLLWLPWLGLPKLCWTIVVRVGTFVLVLILEEMLSCFHYWEWCLLWFCHIWLLVYWGRFLSAHFLESFYYKWMLNFFKRIFLHLCNDHMLFFVSVC